MSLLISTTALSKAFGSRILFHNLVFSIFTKQRVGLIGPNGAGKSTLLKILAQSESPDSGSLNCKRDLKIGYVPQTCTFPDLPIEQVLTQALRQEELPEYEKAHLAQTWLSKLQFKNFEQSATQLSGGWKKRLAFAKELMSSPDLLLLDEPTNHLDLEGILWLEKFLLREAPTFILVSHDRYFLQNVTNRIIEIDKAYPEGIFSIEGSYSFFLQKKEEFLQGQLAYERSLVSKARKEVDWLKSNPKARTTKSQSRIDQTHSLLNELAQVKARNRQKQAEIAFESTLRETRKLLVAKNLCKNITSRCLFRNLNLTLTAGSRIGLMGPNGVGKTTLLKLLAGELSPDEGTIKRAEALTTVYFDQHRSLLSDTTTLREALSPMGDFVLFRGKQVHIHGWCKRFLFSPDILDMPIGKLSGGERARISIAHLMLQPADLLLLDEPTNDLDIPTLETLEESLIDFPGAVVLITHDRCMLDRICQTLLALGDPEKAEVYADFSQWETATLAQQEGESPKKQQTPKHKTRLSKKEAKIEKDIMRLENEVHQLNQLLEDPEVATDLARLQEICLEVGLLENQIEQLYLEWERLEQS